MRAALSVFLGTLYIMRQIYRFFGSMREYDGEGNLMERYDASMSKACLSVKGNSGSVTERDG